jgi:outer membrane protein TolC
MKKLLILLLLLTRAPAQDDPRLSLADAWRMALRDNPSQEAAAARLEQAEARWRQTRAAYQPSLGVSASGTRVGYSNAAQDQNPTLDDSAELYDADLEAGFLLWDGGTRSSRSLSARAGADAAAASLDDTRLDLLASVGRAYTSAQLARENLRIARADAEFQNRQLDDVKRREAAGVASRADRLNFDIRRLSAESSAVQAQANFSAAMSALTALLGLEVSDALPPPADFDPAAAANDAPAFPEAWAFASAQLPSLIQAEEQRKAAEAAIGIIRGEYRPNLSLFGGLNASRSEDPAFDGDDLGNRVGLQISMALWDGGSRSARISEAEASLREAIAGSRQVLLQAQAVLERAINDYNASVEADRLTSDSLTLSRENRDLVEAAYRAGQESLLRLNEAQRDYTTAEARAALARLTREQAWIDLQRAMGSLTVGSP